MDVGKCIEGRRSVRDFRPDLIDDSTIRETLRMANLAPSAGNLQARDFIVVTDEDTKRILGDAASDQEFVRSAPVVIVVCANLKRISPRYGERGRTLYSIQDSAAAIENMILFLHSRGIGSVWVGAFDEAKTRAALGIPDDARPVAIVPIGYPSEEGTRTGRFPLEKLVHKEKW